MHAVLAASLLTILCAAPQTSAPPAQAMLEVRVFEVEGEVGGPAVDVLELDTHRLDSALMILESAGAGSERRLVHLRGLGTFTAGQVLSSPRIVTQEAEPASIESSLDSAAEPILRFEAVWHQVGRRLRLDVGGTLEGITFRAVETIAPLQTLAIGWPQGTSHRFVLVTPRLLTPAPPPREASMEARLAPHGPAD